VKQCRLKAPHFFHDSFPIAPDESILVFRQQSNDRNLRFSLIPVTMFTETAGSFVEPVERIGFETFSAGKL